MSKYDLIIFDLDGTLLDTSPGIFGSVRYAEQSLNLPPIREEELGDFVGPPPKEMYKKKYNLSEEDSIRATLAHREYGMEHAIYEAEKYDGISTVLEELRNHNMKMAVATLKKQKIAEKILSIHALSDYFDIIIGMDDEETYTKKLTIEMAMEAIGTTKALMVGDSEYDYKGAKDANIDFVGVLYGFGLKSRAKGLYDTIETPIELLKCI